ncbi:MAG TPA: carbonic anhydrase [Alphaproteobacteria bacterium]|nr:carbonic anhydrase [Alphaproteobacteria bacterium]
MPHAHDRAHDHGPSCHRLHPPELDRRGFIRLATLGAGVALFAALPGPARAGQTDVLLLSCMDYRLMGKLAQYMAGRGLAEKYDHIVLAGASLGAVTDKYPDWNRTFWQHLDVALQLHHIRKVVVMDHRDCGAYKVVHGIDFAADPAAESRIHAETLRSLAAAIKARHAHLEVETALMALDGTVEAVA